MAPTAMTRGREETAIMRAYRPGRRAILTSLAATLATACAPLTGEPADVAVADRPPPIEGGIGGTGIVGVVTGLGSIRVNGLTVAVPPDAVIADVYGVRDPATLAIGHSVTVEAAGLADRLSARRVAVVTPLAGRIDTVGLDGRRFRLLGVDVVLEPGAPGADLVAAGRRVAVSGAWRGGGVVAARLDPLDAGAPAALAGTVQAGRGPGGRRLAGFALDLPAGLPVPDVGSFAAVLGRPNGGRFVVETVRPGRFAGAAGPLARLSVEGYLEPAAAAPGFVLSGLGHSFDEAARLDPLAGGRAVFVGRYDGTFVVRHGLPLPEGLEARAAVLAGVGDPFAPAGAIGTR